MPKSPEQRAKIATGIAAAYAAGIRTGWPKGVPHSPEQRVAIAASMAERGTRKGPKTRVNECGHPERKHSAKGMCASCYTKAWLAADPTRVTSGNAWLKAHPERARAFRRKAAWKQHGMDLTVPQYNAMHEQQGGKCANPRCDFTAPIDAPDYRHALQVDHDHRTNAVRSLLCPPCNRALGSMDDDTERLAGLIEYIAAHR